MLAEWVVLVDGFERPCGLKGDSARARFMTEAMEGTKQADSMDEHSYG